MTAVNVTMHFFFDPLKSNTISLFLGRNILKKTTIDTNFYFLNTKMKVNFIL